MDWFPLNPDDWDADTMHLDPFQEGCYFRMIKHYMKTQAPIADNDYAIARIVGISVDEWKDKAAAVVRAFFVPKNGFLTHKRCDKELREQDALSKKRKKIAQKAANARWSGAQEELDLECSTHAPSNADAMPENATGQDTTRQDRTGHNKTKPSTFQHQPHEHKNLQPPDPNSARDPEGFNKISVEGLTSKVVPGRFEVMRHMALADIRTAQGLAPGWDIEHLARIFDRNVNDPEKPDFGVPKMPAPAFFKWIPRYTKGKRP